MGWDTSPVMSWLLVTAKGHGFGPQGIPGRFSRARRWPVKSLLRLVPNGLGSGGKKEGLR